MDSYISPKTKRGLQSRIHGRGLFAVDEIEKDEIVTVKGGHILTREQLAKIGSTFHAEMQIADHLFIAPTTEEEYAQSMMCINHSCNPNLGIRGDIVFVALRKILPGEELTTDYAMMDNTSGHFSCICGAPTCRKIITGKDWQKKEIQKKYRGYFSAYLATLIAHES